MLKHPETYEIMTAESVGWSTNRLTLGKLSGRNAFKTKLADLGIELESEEALNAAFARFKELADKKREIFDEDLHALVSDEMGNMNTESYKFISQKISTETGEEPSADIVFSIRGEEKHASASGSGPVDAIFKAIESVAQSGATLQIYSVNAVTQGTESQGETSVRLQRGDRVVNGQGADTDVLVATAKAYLSALSKLEFGQAKPKAQGSGMIWFIEKVKAVWNRSDTFQMAFFIWSKNESVYWSLSSRSCSTEKTPFTFLKYAMASSILVLEGGRIAMPFRFLYS